MAQFLRPDSNVTQTSFTGGFVEIDEATASDADFAYGTNNTAAVLEVGLGNPSGTPASGTTTVRYRVAKTNAGTVDGGGNAVTVTAEVYQGTTLIASDTAKTATGTWTGYSFTPDMSAVTDWTDVRLRFTTSASGGGPSVRRGGAVSWAELEAPDAATLTHYTMVADPGSFTLTGTDAGLLAGRKVAADAATFSLTGTDAALVRAIEIVNSANTTVTNLDGGAVRITKGAGLADNAFNSSAVSNKAVGDFELRITSRTAGANDIVVGVNSDPATDHDYTSIDYGWDAISDGTCWIFESGTGIGGQRANVGGYHWIWRTGTTLGYGRGASLAAAQASPDRTVAGVTAPLYFDSSLYKLDEFVDVLFTGSAPNYTLTAEPGTFTLTGTDAALPVTRQLPADAASFALTGTAAGLLRGTRLAADPASFTYTGTAAGLLYGRKLAADAAAYALTATDAALKAGRKLTADPAVLTLTGTAAGLYFGAVMTAGAGSFALTGTDATLTKTTASGAFTLTAGAASFTFTGADAIFTRGGWPQVSPAVTEWAAQSPAGGAWSAGTPAGGTWTPQAAEAAVWTPEPPAGGSWN